MGCAASKDEAAEEGGSKEPENNATPTAPAETSPAPAPTAPAPKKMSVAVSDEEMAKIREKMAAAPTGGTGSVPFKKGDKTTHKVKRAQGEVNSGELDAIKTRMADKQAKKTELTSDAGATSHPASLRRSVSRRVTRAMSRRSGSGKSSSNLLGMLNHKSSKGLLRGLSRRERKPPETAMQRGVMAAKEKIARERGLAEGTSSSKQQPPAAGTTAQERGYQQAKSKVAKEHKSPYAKLERSISRRWRSGRISHGSSSGSKTHFASPEADADENTRSSKDVGGSKKTVGFAAKESDVEA